MNIAIFGWYHHQNAGDDRIQRCLTRWLDGHTLAFLPAGRPAPVSLLRTYDAVIIGGGGLIRDRGGVFRAMAGWLRAAGIPAALVGISVEGMSTALRSDLRAFMDRAVFSWFRDRGSLEAVGDHPRAFVAPDVTWLYPYPPAVGPGDGVAISLRAEGGLDQDGWHAVLAGLGERPRPWPLFFEGGGDRALLRDLLGEGSDSEEFQLTPAVRAASVIAGRFHAAQFALQLGRPLVAVSSKPKMRHFLAQHDLADWCVAEDRPQDLAALWPRFVAERDRLRERCCALASALHNQVWETTETARDRLLDAAASLPPPHRRFGLRRLLPQR